MQTQISGIMSLLVVVALFGVEQACALGVHGAEMPWIVVAKNRTSFGFESSGKNFVPWGFNYDHDDSGRLLEDYWQAEWPTVVEDFTEMKQLGANVVRVHLQLGKFMSTAHKPNVASLRQLAKLLRLAEEQGLYLDLTGLGCYHKQDVPAWYDRLNEIERWSTQARFWSAVAECCKNSPAVFCYDLMNEPVVPGGKRLPGDWLGGAFAGKHFVQFITLDTGQRQRPEVARAWIQQLSTAIRKQDRRHLITVGLVDWSLERKGLTSGFVPAQVGADLDFLCVHLYPEKGQTDPALETLCGFAVGKPVVIEETFPLKCGLPEFGQFMKRSQMHAAGWLGFYWGKTPDQLRASKTISAAIMLAWLEWFQKNRPAD